MPLGSALPRRQAARPIGERKLRFLLVHADPNHADPPRCLSAAGDEIQRIADALDEYKDKMEVVRYKPAEATN